MSPGGKKEKYPLDIPDLKTALLYAEQDIVVIGLGLIGLIAAQILMTNGCRVIGFD